MPEKSLTIAAYAAGASLAAATLVYIFGPTFFLDEVDSANSRGDRKRIAVGLSNHANDCFINSTLQALAGLPALRLYLIRELHQRQQDGEEVYSRLSETSPSNEKDKRIDSRPAWLRLSLQGGVLTAALKDMLDALNERPVARRTISAGPFILAVEQAFKTRVSRYQQDAQEFLQLVLERLADEHHAGIIARRRAIQAAAPQSTFDEPPDSYILSSHQARHSHDSDAFTEKVEASGHEAPRAFGSSSVESKSEFSGASGEQKGDLPFEGQLESMIECATCHYKPKPAVTTFVTLTLNVPNAGSSTTLDACLDGMLKIEHIDDFKCDKCRLVHAQQQFAGQLARTTVKEQRAALERDLEKIERDLEKIATAIESDPEGPPQDVTLPDTAAAPKRKITRCMRVSVFPKVLAIHLSRSVWDGYSSSSKNTAKVAFPEILQLGSLLDRKAYRLNGMVTHKGGHNSGHYESFRRQWQWHPFAGTDNASADDVVVAKHSYQERGSLDAHAKTLEESETASDTPPQVKPTTSTKFGDGYAPTLKAASQAKLAERKRKAHDRWWRISDDKVKECRLSDVLGMQKEVYLLFYELIMP